MFPLPIYPKEDICIGLAMTRWSQVAWRTLHGVTFLYPEFDIHVLLQPMRFLLPCPICRDHLHEHLVQYPLKDDGTFRYVWYLHHLISGSPPSPTYKDIFRSYEDAFLQDPRGFSTIVHNAAWELGWIFLASVDRCPALLSHVHLYWAAISSLLTIQSPGTFLDMSHSGNPSSRFVEPCLTEQYFTAAQHMAPFSLVWWEQKVQRLPDHYVASESIYFVEDLLGPMLIPYLAAPDVTWVWTRIHQRQHRYVLATTPSPQPPHWRVYSLAVLLLLLIILTVSIIVYRRRKNRLQSRMLNGTI
jgi:hypothetical protein